MTRLENVDKFNALLKSSEREGIEDLISFLVRTSFYTDPASAKYHNNFPGGLMDHSIKVCELALQLNNAFKTNVSSDSIVITALLHDLSKIGSYEIFSRNKKNEFGKWYPVREYKNRRQDLTKDSTADEKLLQVALDHGAKSAFIASQFIHLSIEETEAIANHMTTWSGSESQSLAGIAYRNNKMAFLLHVADEYSTFYLENTYTEIPWEE